MRGANASAIPRSDRKRPNLIHPPHRPSFLAHERVHEVRVCLDLLTGVVSVPMEAVCA